MRFLLTLLLFLFPTMTVAETITIDKVLIHAGERLSRPATEIDSIEQAIIAGSWLAPTVDPGDGAWRQLNTDADGWLRADDLIHGYAYAEVKVAAGGTWILDAMGYAGVIVNGEPRIGNIYGYTDDWESWQPHFDFCRLPVRLNPGRNTFLFFGNRYGVMRARLTRTNSTLMLNPLDTTLPDLVVGKETDSWGSVVVLNATDNVVTDARLAIEIDGGRVDQTAVPPLPPYGLRKVGFPLHAPGFTAAGTRALRVTLSRGGVSVGAALLSLQVKPATANRRVTFISGIDGSVQYYGYLPATGAPGPKALFLSLHGAAVEAINQSGSYAPLNWGHVVAPTNRRPFGFSWEDWGRLDALEVLDLALAQLDIDEDRVYLTGHSMGGHGSWQLATLYPDRFAAVGPSAGWITIWSYRRQPPAGPASALTTLIERGTLCSRTLELAPNLAELGVYVLHGAEDDNVPPAQARLMLRRLSEFHHDFVYHEEPGVGHWWDLSADPGADCVSWPPMFDFFARHRRPGPAEIRSIRFRTPSPAISARDRWVRIDAQQRPFKMSRVDLSRDEDWRQITGTTGNTALLGLDLTLSRRDSVKVRLDGDEMTLAVPADGHLWLAHAENWQAIAQPDPQHKSAHNNGGFREAFIHRVQLVYATGGTAAENKWARAKARYDAEYLWYQGNATVDVLPDSIFDPAAAPDRNVILYGNATTHRHWQTLWNADIRVDRHVIQVGDHSLAGDGLGVLAMYPRPGSSVASVGIVATTGTEGSRLLNRRPYLQFGVAYPDLTIFRNRGDGTVVQGAGFFGNDWTIAAGEFVWEDDQ